MGYKGMETLRRQWYCLYGISAIVYIEIYTGKAPNTQDEIPGIMMADNVVHRLTKNLPYHQNFKLFFDIFPL